METKPEKIDKIVLANLYKDEVLELTYKNEQLNFILSQPPKKEWIAKHPFIKVDRKDKNGNKIKVPYEYLPIDKTEYLLRKIYKRFKVEIKNVMPLFNAVQVTVRVHYFHPIYNEWLFHDGCGAEELQTASRTGGVKPDFSNVNRGAVKMATPLAKSLAVKDACDHFGDLFGANLNRKDTLQFSIDENLKQKFFEI